MEADGLITPTGVLLAPPGIAEADWHTVRAGGIGGSDVAGILGLDRWSSPWKVWAAKTGRTGGTADNEDMRMGRRLEAPIAEEWAERTGCQLLPPVGTLAHAEWLWMRANVDRLVQEARAAAATAEPVIGPLEVKNRNWRAAAEWGDDVPDEPALQLHWYLAVTGYPVGWVCALIGGNRLRWYRVERDQELIDHLIAYCGDWWERHVVGGEQPPADGSRATTELLAHLWEAEPEATVEVDASRTLQLLAHRARLKEQLAALDGELAVVENELKAALGTAEVALIGGRTAYTWVANGTFRSKDFRAEHPELAAEYVKQATVLDLARLAEDHPDIHRRYRARQLRVPTKGALS